MTHFSSVPNHGIEVESTVHCVHTLLECLCVTVTVMWAGGGGEGLGCWGLSSYWWSKLVYISKFCEVWERPSITMTQTGLIWGVGVGWGGGWVKKFTWIASNIFSNPLTAWDKYIIEIGPEICTILVSEYSLIWTLLFAGNADYMYQFRVIVDGDQLTRVRLTGAKNIRTLAPDPHKRFKPLLPFTIEMWHNKQDFLEVKHLSQNLFQSKYVDLDSLLVVWEE